MLVGSRRNSALRKNNSHILVRITVSLILVFAIASAVAIYFEQETRIERMQQKQIELHQTLNEVQSDNAELLELKSLLDTEAYIERIAREKLGMVRPNEIIFED